MKRSAIAFSLSVMLVGSLATLEAAPPKAAPRLLSETPIYTPDIVSEVFAGAANVSATEVSALPTVLPFWADLVNQERVPNDGAGVYVAVLDTGLLPAWPFFLSEATIAWNLGKGFTHEIYWDAAANDIVIGPLRDDRGFITGLASGHGTHVSSTVVGFNFNNSFWVSGVAPKATIIPVLVLDAWEVAMPELPEPVQISGGTDEMVSAGIRYVADLAGTLDGPVIINMSLGGPDRSPMIEAAVNYAISRGVIVVASAGNEGYDGMGYPGGLPQVISAAAGGWADMFNFGPLADVPENLKSSDSLGNHWQIYLEDFSSRPNIKLGQKTQDLDVTAPGAWVVGPYKPDFSAAVGYYFVSGTSMAAPHVSAISALVLQSHAGLGQTALETILKSAARGLPLPACDAIVAFPYIEEGAYSASWNGGDWGAGFIQTDSALQKAAVKAR